VENPINTKIYTVYFLFPFLQLAYFSLKKKSLLYFFSNSLFRIVFINLFPLRLNNNLYFPSFFTGKSRHRNILTCFYPVIKILFLPIEYIFQIPILLFLIKLTVIFCLSLFIKKTGLSPVSFFHCFFIIYSAVPHT
jgi:hypothetical protein